MTKQDGDLVLVGSGTSPFVRKCRVVAHELGVPLTFVRAQQWAPDSDVSALNPLSKVPVLRTPDLGSIYDSRVIVADLERRAGIRLSPADGMAQIRDMRFEALGDGISEAVALAVQETWRPVERRSVVWAERQRAKIDRGLAAAEDFSQAGQIDGGALTPGVIALACAVEFAAFWLPSVQWRSKAQSLSAQLSPILERAAFVETRPTLPPGATFPSL
jgi:glutathione S-transferase